ncbi:MAG: type III pantothenate kinase [Flavobacteriales bacterium]|jgi:type III pantothenate kinase|nr:type III pantothenate kinase [Flavobacteriales bacterium]MBT3963893.1 type III pantothenate kinase [Flavobacteriales bacterium]MBT4706199.1 type III pantothenate kinase [Flavobacteriales bacterium]MBT4931384.1 type III pantothenate kinase [Flavobacteriales bacterium]MBT5133182.1 type III pantothenate kinase [Flavobacteriales bacterium]
MNLIIDVGNTRIKAGVFDGDELIEVHTEKLNTIDVLIEKIAPGRDWSAAIASVSVELSKVNFLSDLKSVLHVNHKTPLPIESNYETPESLGIDRICGVVAANIKFPNQNCLVIDIGTCITYDVIDDQGYYQGGGISPGFEMRLKAMNHFTQRLPLVNPTSEFPSLGQSTEGSLLFGAGRGMAAEINGIINTFKADYQGLKVILTGGGSANFEPHLENPIFAAPNLILKGLNNILLHNQGLHA